MRPRCDASESHCLRSSGPVRGPDVQGLATISLVSDGLMWGGYFRLHQNSVWVIFPTGLFFRIPGLIDLGGALRILRVGGVDQLIDASTQDRVRL